jgi:hypothetical protein
MTTKENIVSILDNAGYKTITGYQNVLNAIKAVSDGIDEQYCSGHRIFPDGTICTGCPDCCKEENGS